MPAARLSRDEFYDQLSGLDEAGLKKALWTVYWRGTAPTRERIEAEIDPRVKQEKRRAAEQLPDPDSVRSEVQEFAALARAGAYLAGDRRVSPKERSRWRFTFRRLADDAQRALAAEDFQPAAEAVATLVDLACEALGYDYFRSDDPVAAARFVVSDAVAAMWGRTRQVHGFDGFARRAAPQLLRWEREFGWTRHGFGAVTERETSLTQVVDSLVPVPGQWGDFADRYLEALDGAAGRGVQDRSDRLARWHSMLLERLAGSPFEDRLDRLSRHPALGGPEHDFFGARLAADRGDLDRARRLVGKARRALPGHPGFLDFAREVGASRI